MDRYNKHENRAQQRAANEPKVYTLHLPSALAKSVSVDENIRVEIHTADPDYTRSKALTGSAPLADQANPNSTPPSGAEIWDMKGYRGGHGYVILDQAETVDVELWALDPTNNKWFVVAAVSGIGSYEEFRFPDQVRGRSIWLRLINIGATIESITLRFSPE